jgi:nicotinamide-nucleotide amidase
VTNTHLAYLAQSLFGLGLRVERQVTVPDGVAIAEALAEAMPRAEVIIVTGGLGPTSDDITREAVAEAFGKKLIFHQEILDGIAAKFARRKIVMNDMQNPQAMVENDRVVAILLPGPPNELRPMWENEALPWLRKRFAAQLGAISEVTLRVLGIGETRVQMMVEEEIKALGPVEIGYCARPGEVDLRLIAPDAALLKKAAELARAKLGDVIFAEGTETMEEAVVRLARAAGKTVATAESCTGGLVAHRITNISGSSEVFRYGWVTYANAAKTAELGVAAELLEKHGAVSAEVAQAMAEGALRHSGADVAVAITGIAGPNGGTEGKPVGTVYLALAAKGRPTQTARHLLASKREPFKYMASQIALDLLRRALI